MATLLPQKPQAQGTYTFASQPRAVQQRKKYRDAGEIGGDLGVGTQGPPQYGNIMYDKRIVRGNTYAQHTLPAHAQPDPIEIQRQQENRRRAIARKRAKEQLRPRSPEPVEGRKHIDVQTELYLEELSDRVEEADVEVQTDAFLDRPPSPMFVPAKTGLDMATQILDGELFDFDVEVKPILEVLVGKTVEQALLEVMEEEELANLRSQQRAFEELRNAELVEQQRLEEQERRHREEKERRMKQQREILKKEHETSEKIAARAFAQSYLADLVPTVFGTLSDNGYFYDPVERDIEQGFMPWLMDQVKEQLHKAQLGRMVLDGILREVVSKRFDQYAKLDEKLREMLGDTLEMDKGGNSSNNAPEEVPAPAAATTTEAEKPVEPAEEPAEQKTDESGGGEQQTEGGEGEEEDSGEPKE
ncbi:radial spoke head protein 3 homolog B-like [Mizuhopecten yessoensis]|uniref:Radial spoke head protein 3-like n=1 Tax=Mizuhopecten yessoensis TaxID=6573 RepID=A0A210PM41_MIZYE|nr:radial spoke head protein 3 homolog B-like [Mizuhopecten yessoensis]OWF37527.1 Radial spoke head protein 3-like [Mizuhopecten yessoensis]